MNKVFAWIGGGLLLLLSFVGGVITEDTNNIFDTQQGFVFEQKQNDSIYKPKQKNENSGIFSWLSGSNNPFLSTSDQKDILEEISLQTTNEAYSLLSKYYVDPDKISKEKLEEGLIRGLVYSVDDPYTTFFNDEQSEEFKKSMQGDFEGIGAVLEKQKDVLTITEVLKGRPAAKSGLLPGDIILSVDNTTTENENIYDTIMRIRGEKGTIVTLEIYRPSKSKKIIVPITRAMIHVESVVLTWRGEKKDIAVFEISQFGDEMINEFTKLFAQAFKKNPKGIIIDLRYNGGGYLEGAVDLASFFLKPNTEVVSIVDKEGEKNTSYTTSQKLQSLTLPLTILINGGSASASEIFVGAITDSKRGTTLGEETFGKGSVQQIFPLGNEGQQVKITIAKWFTPSGKNPTHEEPFTPDVLVEFDRTEMTDAQREEKYDPQLDRAIEDLEKN